MKRINGRTARPYVQRKEPFKNSNGQLYAQWHGAPSGEDPNARYSRYVVYSYGVHWPLFVYIPQTNQWFENRGRHSVTTSKHRAFTHPHCDTVPLSVENIKLLARLGYSSMVFERLTGGNTNG